MVWGPLHRKCWVSWHLYWGWNSCSKNWCMCQCTCFTPPMLWACKFQNEERWGWSNHCQSYLLSLTGVISTSATGMQMLTSTPLLSLYIGHFTLYLPRKLWETSKWMHSLLFTCPTGVSPVWCWAGNGQFALCGISTVSLFWVCSSRVVVVHLACLACTTILRWVPSVWVMKKSQFWWRIHEHLVHWFFMRYEWMPSTSWYSTSYGSSSHGSFTSLLPCRHWL